MTALLNRLAFVVFALILSAAACSPPAGPPVHDPALLKRVFVDVNNAPIAEVLGKIAESGGYSVELRGDRSWLRRPVTLTMINVTAETALKAACETAGCRWQMSAHTLEVDGMEPPPAAPLIERVMLALNTPLGAGWKFDHRPIGEILMRFSDYTPSVVQVEGEATH